MAPSHGCLALRRAPQLSQTCLNSLANSTAEGLNYTSVLNACDAGYMANGCVADRALRLELDLVCAVSPPMWYLRASLLLSALHLVLSDHRRAVCPVLRSTVFLCWIKLRRTQPLGAFALLTGPGEALLQQTILGTEIRCVC